MDAAPLGDLIVTVAAQGSSIVLAFDGELDLATAPFAQSVIDSVFTADPPPHVVLDRSALRFMDTNGIDILNQCGALGRKHRCLVGHRGAHGIVAALLALPAIDVAISEELPALSWN